MHLHLSRVKLILNFACLMNQMNLKKNLVPNTHLVIYVQKYLLCNEKMFHWYKITYELQHVQFLLSSTCENFFTNLLYCIRKKFSKQNQLLQSEGYPKTYYQMIKNFKEMLTDKVHSNN